MTDLEFLGKEREAILAEVKEIKKIGNPLLLSSKRSYYSYIVSKIKAIKKQQKEKS